MIEKLTPEQEKQMVEFREEILKIGLSTDRINIEQNDPDLAFIYKEFLGIDKCPYVWMVESPVQFNLIKSALIGIAKNETGSEWKNLRDNLWYNLRKNLNNNLRKNLCLNESLNQNLLENLEENLNNNLRKNLEENLWKNLQDNLWDNLRNYSLDNRLDDRLNENLWDNLWYNLRKNLEENLWDSLWYNLRKNLLENLEENLWKNLEENLWKNLEENLWENLWENLRKNLEENLQDNLWNNFQDTFDNIYWSHMDIYWMASYKFSKDYLGIDYVEDLNEKLEKVYNFFRRTGFVFFFKDICFISQRPTILKKKGILLHCDGGPAIAFSDGYEIHYLNGIEVPKYLAETPGSQLDIEFFKKEKNADIRAEFILKYGIDRMVHLGKKIDSWKNYTPTPDWWAESEYELYDMSSIFKSIEYAPHLKMKNQTTGIYHLEGVSPECKTLKQALEMRTGIKNFKIRSIK